MLSDLVDVMWEPGLPMLAFTTALVIVPIFGYLVLIIFGSCRSRQ